MSIIWDNYPIETFRHLREWQDDNRLWRQKNGRPGRTPHPEVPLVEWDGSEAPRAEEIVYCREVLQAGAELMGSKWPQYLDECQRQKRHGEVQSPSERNRLYRGRKIMNAWAEENT